MYLRHTTVTRNGKTHTYWRLVHSVRVGRRVRQETVTQLGELDAQGRVRSRRAFAVSPLAMGDGLAQRRCSANLPSCAGPAELA